VVFVNQAGVNQAGIDGIDDLFDQRSLGQALPIAAPAPIILDIAIGTPKLGPVPITVPLQKPDDGGLVVRPQQVTAKPLVVAHGVHDGRSRIPAIRSLAIRA